MSINTRASRIRYLLSWIFSPVVLYLIFSVSAPTVLADNAVGRIIVVAPNGEDSNPGTVLLPLKTLSMAVEMVRSGDTVFVREGEYPAGISIVKSGVRNAPVVFRNFPGERPLISGHGQTEIGLKLDNVEFVTIRGFEIRGVGAVRTSLAKVPEWGGILLKDTRHSVVEANVLVTGDVIDKPEAWMGAPGIQLLSLTPGLGCTENEIRGNDASRAWSGAHTMGPSGKNIFEGNNFHHNQESGEDSDGAGQDNSARKKDSVIDKTPYNPAYNVYRYNVFASNSDDGLDMWVSVNNLVEYNISSGNGLGEQGDGNGFKMGPGGHNIVRYCIAILNRANAFDDNWGQSNLWESNLSFGNGHLGEGGEGSFLVTSREGWQQNKLRQHIQGKVDNYRNGLVEQVPPNAPRNLQRVENQLVWLAPLPAVDGDGAEFYLLYNEQKLIGISKALWFELPPGIRGQFTVCAIDDSYLDNQSECTPLIE